MYRLTILKENDIKSDFNIYINDSIEMRKNFNVADTFTLKLKTTATIGDNGRYLRNVKKLFSARDFGCLNSPYYVTYEAQVTMKRDAELVIKQKKQGDGVFFEVRGVTLHNEKQKIDTEKVTKKSALLIFFLLMIPVLACCAYLVQRTLSELSMMTLLMSVAIIFIAIALLIPTVCVFLFYRIVHPKKPK